MSSQEILKGEKKSCDIQNIEGIKFLNDNINNRNKRMWSSIFNVLKEKNTVNQWKQLSKQRQHKDVFRHMKTEIMYYHKNHTRRTVKGDSGKKKLIPETNLNLHKKWRPQKNATWLNIWFLSLLKCI